MMIKSSLTGFITGLGLLIIAGIQNPARFDGYWSPVITNVVVENMSLLDPNTISAEVSFKKNRSCYFKSLNTYFEFTPNSNIWFYVKRDTPNQPVSLPTGQFVVFWKFYTDAERYLNHRIKIDFVHECHGIFGDHLTETVQITKTNNP